jgi:hypothetical protein
MTKYYVNNGTQSNGDHEVHRDGCSYMPSDRKYLGEFDNCRDAVNAARQHYKQVNGCYYCSNECHTQ